MYSLLLAIIYISFISLGLPDSLLGAAWPVMHGDLGVPQSLAGVITMIISADTILSSLLSDRLTHRFGAGRVTAVSVLTTAVALFGFSISTRFWMLCLWAVPYGLGAGAVDAALNNFVALHYSSRHMSWLHCFWGVGASVSPYIMSAALTGGLGWGGGYRIVSVIQFILTACIFLSLPLWTRAIPRSAEAAAPQADAADRGPIPLRDVIRIPGAAFLFLMFFAYCGVEQTSMLWASTYMVSAKAVPVEEAARFAALFTLGITLSRFLSGFISNRLGDRNMIRLGSLFLALGLILVALPVKGTAFAIAGLMMTGFGCGPIYPSIIHATPDNFGADKSQAIIGMQMASAYVGTTFLPPLLGLLSGFLGIGIFPVYVIALFVLMLAMFTLMNRSLATETAR